VTNQERQREADTLELAAQWLEHNAMWEAAATVRMIKPGQITAEDLAWADAKIAEIEASEAA
jgi:hypothetical protein